MRANLPDKYKTTTEIRGLLANIDLNLLPNELVDRIAAGENPLAVLASAAKVQGTTTRKLLEEVATPEEGPAPPEEEGEAEVGG